MPIHTDKNEIERISTEIKEIFNIKIEIRKKTNAILLGEL